MYTYPSEHNYDRKPCTAVTNHSGDVIVGNKGLADLIGSQINQGNKVFVFDLYPGVDQESLCSLLEGLQPKLIFKTDTCKLSEEELHQKFEQNITEDRVFGYMVDGKLESGFDQDKMAEARARIVEVSSRINEEKARITEVKLRYAEAKSGITEEKIRISECKTRITEAKFRINEADSKLDEVKNEVIFIVGVGASLFAKADVHYYFDITRWEIQLRFRNGMTNWMFDNPEAPILTKYKMGFFIEWRLADAHKEEHFAAIDYWVDATVREEIKVIDRETFYQAFHKISREPFRMEPYFDKSVWGGQWMKQHFGLAEDVENFGWAFDGVPEENSVRFTFGDVSVTFPTMNLVKLFPKELLGEKVYHTFGAEFPIRFDMLDTFEGGNLSLQVHPTLNYIKSAFGMSYTQDESYYILDATENSCVYLGLKEGIDPEAMIADLEAANRGEMIFDVEKYVNKIPVKKHDHILIPAGTVHCSGKDTMVLEISATPYIFTFKLWDWGHIGLDGLPRPVHINHGKQTIQWDRDTNWVGKHLLHQEKVLYQDESIMIERTGLHAYEFIETLRYTFREKVEIVTEDSVVVLNLIEGEEAWIKSSDDRWRPKKIHYGETFIVPACMEHFMMEACGGNEVRVIVAMIR